jgi:hypothetical protein
MALIVKGPRRITDTWESTLSNSVYLQREFDEKIRYPRRLVPTDDASIREPAAARHSLEVSTDMTQLHAGTGAWMGQNELQLCRGKGGGLRNHPPELLASLRAHQADGQRRAYQKDAHESPTYAPSSHYKQTFNVRLCATSVREVLLQVHAADVEGTCVRSHSLQTPPLDRNINNTQINSVALSPQANRTD